MKFIIALATFLAAALGASAAPQGSANNGGCLESGLTCVLDPPKPGEVVIDVEFCSDCCSGSFTPSLVGNTGVCN